LTKSWNYVTTKNWPKSRWPINKNLSELSAGMLRQGILNSHNDFVKKLLNRRIVEMIQSGWVGRQNWRKLWSRGVIFTKMKYRFTDFFRYFFFGIRYFSVFGIPTSLSVSVFWNTSVFGIGIGYRPRTSKQCEGFWVCLNNRLSVLSMVCCIVGMVLASPRRLALRARASKRARSMTESWPAKAGRACDFRL